MRSMWVIFSKEFLDIIRDRRRFILTLLTMFVFFPLFMIVPYSYIITRTVKQTVDGLVIPVQGTEHAPALIAYLAGQEIEVVTSEDVVALVNSKQYVVGLIIPADYEVQVDAGHSVELVLVTDKRRTLDVTFNRLEDALDDYGRELVQARLEQQGLSDDFFTPLTIKEKNVASITETTGSRMGLFIPGFILTFGLTAGMPIAIAAIAGEKKKLTLEPVLFTTVNRFQLVFAKLLAVSVSMVITLLSILISFSIAGVGIFLIVARSLPVERIVSSAADGAAEQSASAVSMGQYHIEPLAIILFLLAPFLIILLGAALQILISTWARNDEEATTYLMPISIFSGFTAFLAFFLEDFTPHLWHYGIPIMGTILSMRDLLSNRVDLPSLAVMFGTSALYALLMIALAVWMFQREEVVFRT